MPINKTITGLLSAFSKILEKKSFIINLCHFRIAKNSYINTKRDSMRNILQFILSLTCLCKCIKNKHSNIRKYILSMFYDLSNDFRVINHKSLVKRFIWYKWKCKKRSATCLLNRKQHVDFMNNKSSVQYI